uniref:RRM domain-containing protein n=1 Tax=Helicotheca tamesis TaxID=374047 RepID=A0A7S2H5L6_9STRA
MAFSDDKNFSRCHPLTDSCRIEANALCDAYDFMRRNAHPSAAVPDNETERITIVHDQLVQMVNNVRRGAISPTAAARTIHSIQMITGLAEFPAIWEVTVVFFGLKDTTTSSELRKTMEQFGEIEAAAVADSGRGFGFCSFRSSSSAWYSIQGCRNREALLNGEPLNAMRIQNGNWLDPILLSPTTPKRSNLNLSMNTYTEEEEKQPIPDLVSSTTSSPVLKASSAMSPPKNTPIRFLKKFFKSPKQPEPENNDNETGAPQIPMLDHAKENENCCDNKDIFLRMDDDIQEPDDDDINPPMIRRRSWRFDVISDDTSHESPTSGEQIKEKVQRQAVISETSSRRLCNDTEEPEVNDSNDSSFPPTVQNAKINSNIVNNQHLHGKCSDPTINNKNKSLQSEIKSPRGVFFGLSPLKPRAIFHRRQHPCSVSNSSIAVTHISDDDWTNDTNTFVGEKIY